MNTTKKRPSRATSKHTRRSTLEDSQGFGRLTVDGMEEGYYYRVVNSKDQGRLQRLQDRGFEAVERGGNEVMGEMNDKEVGTVITTTVNKAGEKAILMRQPIEFRREDEAFKQRQVDEKEEDIFRTLRQASDKEGSEVIINDNFKNES